MIRAELENALSSALEQVLDRMFFVCPEGDGGEVAPVSGPQVAAQLAFEGDASGHIRVSVSLDAARSIAADFIAGEVEETTEQQVNDVICELTNMVCGATLSRLGRDIRLHAPQIVSEEDAVAESEAIARSLDIGTGTITVILHCNGAVCPQNTSSAS